MEEALNQQWNMFSLLVLFRSWPEGALHSVSDKKTLSPIWIRHKSELTRAISETKSLQTILSMKESTIWMGEKKLHKHKLKSTSLNQQIGFFPYHEKHSRTQWKSNQALLWRSAVNENEWITWDFCIVLAIQQIKSVTWNQLRPSRL